MSGQLINKWTHHRLTNLLRSISGDRGRKYTIAGDTDSVVGDTFIDVNGVKQTIAEFYDSISDDQLIRDELDNKVKLVDGCQGLSVNVKTKEIESKPIKYVMKHLVKKRMYAIHVDGKNVVVTEDHSIMVMRDDMIISVKPKEILKSDIIITNDRILKFNSDFEIQDLGLIEQDVYDIEIEDNHNFFGNDILVHNSLYVSIPDIVDMMLPNNKDLDIHQIVDKIDEFVKVVVDPEVNKWCVDLVDYMQAYKNKMVWEREIIAECLHPDTIVNGVAISKLFDDSIGDSAHRLSAPVKGYKSGSVIDTESDFISRKEYKGELICIELDDGKTLKLTPNHVVFCKCIDGTIIEKQACMLEDGDDVIIKS